MSPTINVNDFVVVNKHIFSDAVKGSANATLPQRGDIIAFKSPQAPDITFLKRVIGTPGDAVSFNDKRLRINGVLVETQNVDDFMFSEQLGKTTYRVQYLNEENSFRTFETVVPDNHYFVMGDNWDNSADSRMWGFVPAENLVGKLVTIW